MSAGERTALAERIKRLRLRLGLTQERFAAKIGVTFSTVNRWENGKGRPSPLAMSRIDELVECAEKGEMHRSSIEGDLSS